MKDRSTSIDLLLSFAAIFVITLALWPRSGPRQIVKMRDDKGTWKTYSFDIKDPNLETLREKVQEWTNLDGDPEYVAAKWQLELSEFYAQAENAKRKPNGETESPGQPPSNVALLHLEDSDLGSALPPTTLPPTTATLSDSVATVSFEQPSSEEGELEQAEFHASEEEDLAVGGALPSPSDANYWATVKEAATAKMTEIESRRSDVPISFENVTASASPQLAFHFAFLLGIGAACGYMHWLKHVPAEKAVPLEKQPLKVLARAGTFTGLIAFAMITAIAVWI